jgi:hypothetical protein
MRGIQYTRKCTWDANALQHAMVDIYTSLRGMLPLIQADHPPPMSRKRSNSSWTEESLGTVCIVRYVTTVRLKLRFSTSLSPELMKPSKFSSSLFSRRQRMCVGLVVCCINTSRTGRWMKCLASLRGDGCSRPRQQTRATMIMDDRAERG